MGRGSVSAARQEGMSPHYHRLVAGLGERRLMLAEPRTDTLNWRYWHLAYGSIMGRLEWFDGASLT